MPIHPTEESLDACAARALDHWNSEPDDLETMECEWEIDIGRRISNLLFVEAAAQRHGDAAVLAVVEERFARLVAACEHGAMNELGELVAGIRDQFVTLANTSATGLD